MRLSVTLQDV
jgi:hypothetical protein